MLSGCPGAKLLPQGESAVRRIPNNLWELLDRNFLLTWDESPSKYVVVEKLVAKEC